MRRRLTHRWMGVAVLAVIAALALGACGDDDDDSGSDDTTAASTTATTGGGESVSLSEVDFKIDPSSVDVKAGEVTFDVTNDGATTHALEVEGNGVEEESDDIAPGESTQLTVDLSKAGNYEMYCPIGNHRQMGMEGEITVG